MVHYYTRCCDTIHEVLHPRTFPPSLVSKVGMKISFYFGSMIGLRMDLWHRNFRPYMRLTKGNHAIYLIDGLMAHTCGQGRNTSTTARGPRLRLHN
uniref:Uncharacterized protein n=1 Tax=Lactuca sativa TaxID=4236 RepID=A0A9R1UK52_LACSA|nr:hypothetical protein LSAT_V11C800442210 [Lactuca sativa]